MWVEISKTETEHEDFDIIHFDDLDFYKRQVITTSPSDREKLVYEGGMKIWECTFDLMDYFKQNPPSATVLELGCGQAIVSLYLSIKYGSKVYLQEYNQEVLDRVTIPNLRKNHVDAQVYCGSWEDFPMFSVDMIVASEILYETDQYPSLKRILSASPVA